MVERDRIEFQGKVLEACKGVFLVKVNENLIVQCSISGKIRSNGIKILVGDTVDIEVSEYDTSKGRITFRHKS